MSDEKTCTKGSCGKSCATSCIKGGCIFHCLTLLANLALIGFLLYTYSGSHGADAHLILLVTLVPVMSVIALRKGGDKEERELKKRIRKAELRKQLDDLGPYDKTE